MRFVFIVLVIIGIIGCKPAEKPSEQIPVVEIALPEFSVDGIIYDDDNSVAVINGDVHRVGDVVDGARLTEITKQQVCFEFNNEIFTLSVKETIPHGSDNNTFPALSVEGIIYDEQSPLAVINGDIRQPGDVILGATIIEITQDYVIFAYDNQRFQRGIDSAVGEDGL